MSEFPGLTTYGLGSGDSADALISGLCKFPESEKKPNQYESVKPLTQAEFQDLIKKSGSPSTSDVAVTADLYDVHGVPLKYSSDWNSNLEIGGHRLSFDPTTNRGIITPALRSAVNEIDSGGVSTYTGSDLRILLEVADASLPYASGVRLAKQLIECTTLSVSTHREKAPVRAMGYINPKGFARGKRTIAGSLILTQGTADILFRFLQATLWNDTSKDSHYVKTDQLPPLNLTLIFSDEYGNASFRRLLGVELLTDGTVYSVQDLLTEQTISYMAADFTPLLPFDLSCLSGVPLRWSGKAERTVADVLKGKSKPVGIGTDVFPTSFSGPATV